MSKSAELSELIWFQQSVNQLKVNINSAEAKCDAIRDRQTNFLKKYNIFNSHLLQEINSLSRNIRQTRSKLRDTVSTNQLNLATIGAEASNLKPICSSSSDSTGPVRAHNSLKLLWRNTAKKLHPDRVRKCDNCAHRTFLMAELNDAYSRGDVSRVIEIAIEQGISDLDISFGALRISLVDQERQLRETLSEQLLKVQFLQNNYVCRLQSKVEGELISELEVEQFLVRELTERQIYLQNVHEALVFELETISQSMRGAF